MGGGGTISKYYCRETRPEKKKKPRATQTPEDLSDAYRRDRLVRARGRKKAGRNAAEFSCGIPAKTNCDYAPRTSGTLYGGRGGEKKININNNDLSCIIGTGD